MGGQQAHAGMTRCLATTALPALQLARSQAPPSAPAPAHCHCREQQEAFKLWHALAARLMHFVQVRGCCLGQCSPQQSFLPLGAWFPAWLTVMWLRGVCQGEGGAMLRLAT